MSKPNNNFDDFDTQIQCDEFEPDVMEDLMNDPDFEDHIDIPCGDVVGSDDDDIADLFTEDGGLTAGAYEMLAKWDADGVFV